MVPDSQHPHSDPDGKPAGVRLSDRQPLIIAGTFFLLNIVWYVLSEMAVVRWLPDIVNHESFDIYKCWIYICASTVLLYAVLRRHHRHYVEDMQSLSRMAATVAASEEQVRKSNVELERRVNERTRELESANRELEAFVHAVSHDLRAPLRGVTGFGQALLDLAPQGLDDKSKHYLKRIQEASQRMSDLIDDLLALSRINQSQMVRQEVDFSHLAAECASRIGERYPGRQVTLRIEPGMTVQGDLRLLRIALDNLLDNAWKYTAPRELAVIEVGSETVDGERRFHVRDNGVGFDMAYAGKLFGPFQRMHGDAQFPGTGIGLVTVQRILTRHGGRIWADAVLNRGTTMTFTLPLAGASA